MAYEPRNLATSNGDYLFPLRATSEHTSPKTFASGTGVLEALTPLAFNTSTNRWVVWEHNGSNGTGTISGFVWPDPVTLHSVNDVLGQVLLKGRVNYNDIVLPYGQLEANLKTALRSGPLARGIIIEGLDQVH